MKNSPAFRIPLLKRARCRRRAYGLLLFLPFLAAEERQNPISYVQCRINHKLVMKYPEDLLNSCNAGSGFSKSVRDHACHAVFKGDAPKFASRRPLENRFLHLIIHDNYFVDANASVVARVRA